ncbi:MULTISPECIES: NfeD family protein [Nostocales]|jgi:membrane protein implicated in regulation of membrane protease activity|uniref:NfeD family protein n=1 Tax=Aphanizomenon flos-aquae FACHB-1040 TaxID=2692887 RepID=A0ABR8BSR9_APHFL|nr:MULTISPECIES: NfeD family protein [Nostocales]MBO1071719.1 NfeD family protein [Dolichospermum sp. DEX189]MCX5981620.1 NfeD family protein [Nostocales cyanobacterium LacPavin_0920_SED1_MAG_38_18]QSV72832.1 MAG: NfeD family protein [Aphanizomenon flos-aquae KM1D3_PB]ALB40064.1 membrane protein implicated in regulation of membrane protease activity [Anabaena sp. WA102]KHG39525.1 membrane protein implicated in regulation of membrane protease activity [Aphanizomenon flos-aquae 2012/KM1/D3]
MPSSSLIWLLAGSVLCLTELFLPSAFVAFMMGISALIVGLLSYSGIGNLWIQVAVWLFLSTTLIILSRRFLQPRRRKSPIQDAVIGETLTEILPGQVGRVLYEGNSWRAKCDDHKISLPPQQTVYVVRREGTTLIVMPDYFLS